ncbi:General secretion pathway protein J [Candidatus Methylobacter favarea]|uniref:General secretion pathway protein J n=1 Tax=Candidatus Methylobacter favarea TaxID=2707345 RepID=A0A8S0XTZ1_9GAMM|nr:prepilin-type N-terminal cleavage/methylation domain-containing protein [Candidatus Methylobacter favarea]CAA9892168.1 General secretion pathway protein J [Candidatus Methylobacter favarea]
MKDCKTSQGFTLIEVLIAMTLLSIMVVLLFTSLKICADSWEKGETKITEVNEVAVVYNFFQRHLSTARPLLNDFTPEGEILSFQGKTRSMQFVSAFPASAGRAGLQMFSVELQKEDKDQVIKVAVIPYFPEAEDEQRPADEVVLIRRVSDFELAYFGADQESGESHWQDEWLEKNIQPQLVKIRIKPENGIFWPDMIIELKVVSLHNNPDITGNLNNSEDINNPGTPGNMENPATSEEKDESL